MHERVKLPQIVGVRYRTKDTPCPGPFVLFYCPHTTLSASAITILFTT